jgi:V/A-type H+-transporting ATPase subunit E
MEKTLEKSHDKIQKICNQLKRETLEPAEKEAGKIIAEAQEKGHQIIHEAEKKGERIVAEAVKKMETEQNVFRSSLQQAAKQGIETLRQEIEHNLFTQTLFHMVDEGTKQTPIVVKIVDAIVKALEKEGVHSELSAIVPKEVSAKEVLSSLAPEVVKKLEKGSVVVGNFKGGAKVKLQDKKITLDLSDQAIKELLASYVRKDFRELLFGV